MAQLGGSANLNVPRPGRITPNFAIVPVGANGEISLFLASGGNVIVDLMGVFAVAPEGGATAGRLVPEEARRVLDTRPDSGGPVPDGWSPHKPAANTTVGVADLPVGASSVVVNITATEADAPGFLRAGATGTTGSTAVSTANGNFEPGVSSGTTSIVPVAQDGTIEIRTSASTHLVVDLLGWFTGTAAPAGSGLFVPHPPSRVYDSRSSPAAARHGDDTTTRIPVAGTTQSTPTGALAVSANLAADGSEAEGFVTLHPSGTARPATSNLNLPASTPVSNGTLQRIASDGSVDAYVNRSTHVIIDVNGYFTGSE
jgi:hypothetical protein